MRWTNLLLLSGLAVSQIASAAGHLEIEGAWIRTAPPGSMMLAGYATLRNSGDAPVTVTGASSEAFGDVSLHESVEVDGVARMKAIGAVEIAPGATMLLAPGGKHLMLMRPKHDIEAGQKITIRIATKSGDGAGAEFVVRDSAP